MEAAGAGPAPLWQQLHERGVVVIGDERLVRELPALRQGFFDALRSFPTYLPAQTPSGLHERYVLGGFSALNNPSSYHNPFVRMLREWVMYVLVERLFTEFVCNVMPAETRDRYRLEQIIDRMMYRPPGVEVGAETWHRDEAPLQRRGDHVLGGWINLDLEDQFFSCVPTTHRDVDFDTRPKKGFGRLRDPREIARAERLKELIRIPPGHVMVFYEDLVHEVVKRKMKRLTIRLFLGWRLTLADTPLDPQTMRYVHDQAQVDIKSGQLAAGGLGMYSPMNWNQETHRYKNPLLDFPIQRWSRRTIRPEIRVQRQVQKSTVPGRTGLVLDVVPFHMKSLREYERLHPGLIRMYPAYTVSERRILEPHRDWLLLPPGERHHRAFVALECGLGPLAPKRQRRSVIVVDDDDTAARGPAAGPGVVPRLPDDGRPPAPEIVDLTLDDSQAAPLSAQDRFLCEVFAGAFSLNA